MTVYSYRCGVPTLPATAAPEDTPMAASTSAFVPASANSSLRSVCAARRALAAWSGWSAGAPKMHSAPSPSNLLTHPPSAVTTSTTTSKKALRVRTTTSAPSRSARAVEPTRSTNMALTSRRSPSRCTPLSNARLATSTPTCRPNRSARRRRSRRPATIRLNPIWR